MKVNAIKCGSCKDVVFSRARHDYRSCSCGEVSVDGGFEYFKVSFKKEEPEVVKLSIKATKKNLLDDWNLGKDKYGKIRDKKTTNK